MTWYSDLPGRRARQILADLTLVAWAVLWALAGHWVKGRTEALLSPAGSLVTAGDSITHGMATAGDEVKNLPYVGGQLEGTFDRIGGTGEGIAQAGRDLMASGERLGLLMGVLLFCAMVLPALALWAPVRVGFAMRAQRLQQDLHAATAPAELLALRALATRPVSELVQIDADPVGAWRAGDEAVVRRLASLELRASGLGHHRMPGGEVVDVAPADTGMGATPSAVSRSRRR